MSTIVTRVGKGSPLTWTEVDSNFTNLNTDKLQSGDTAASLTITSATINGGSINSTTVGASTRSSGAFTTLAANGATTFTAGTASTSTTTGTAVITGGLGVSGRINAANFDGIVGANTAAAGTFTSLSDSGNLTFTGTGNRITGDFINATLANRVLFQSSTTNSNTSVGAIPNGTASTVNFRAYGASDPTNTSFLDFALAGTIDARFTSGISGSGTYLPMTFYTGGSERMRIDTSGNVGIGTTSPSAKLDVSVSGLLAIKSTASTGTSGIYNQFTNTGGSFYIGIDSSTASTFAAGNYAATIQNTTSGNMVIDQFTSNSIILKTANTERMRIDSSGNVLVAKTSASSATLGCELGANGQGAFTASSTGPLIINRLTDDGTLVSLRQAGTEEGTISVSGTTVSYNGGHLSRWSQWQNEIGKPEVYRGTVLESVDAMCVWEKDGQPLPNEQATKTIVSTTPSSKAVAGVFDMYDEDDQDNPYDFYVAQSGDFVIRIAQGVTVQNGDLLESAGDGTARPQADDICRSSTIAKVTSNYVSATYEDGSYCVPCILMIG